jgi:hypothetical protein
MDSEHAAHAVVIDVVDLAQLLIAAAEQARPGQRFRVELDDLLDVLGEVGPGRLPKNRRAHEHLVRCALDTAHGAVGRDQ